MTITMLAGCSHTEREEGVWIDGDASWVETYCVACGARLGVTEALPFHVSDE